MILFELLNQSETWAVSQESGTRVIVSFMSGKLPHTEKAACYCLMLTQLSS